jgi:hypothetical protein
MPARKPKPKKKQGLTQSARFSGTKTKPEADESGKSFGDLNRMLSDFAPVPDRRKKPR